MQAQMVFTQSIRQLPVKNTFVHFDERTSDSLFADESATSAMRSAPPAMISKTFQTKWPEHEAKHIKRECRPCAYYLKKADSCRLAGKCGFCHLCPQGALQARKKEMQADLDEQLRQLDSERKEGLHRLDWELAEAIEALHAKHADRANKIIGQHKETINLLERRAQAGEELTPESLQRVRDATAQAPAPVQAPQATHHLEHIEEDSQYSEYTASESDEEEEEESEDEGIFSQVFRMIRGDDPEPPVRRAPRPACDSRHTKPAFSCFWNADRAFQNIASLF